MPLQDDCILSTANPLLDHRRTNLYGRLVYHQAEFLVGKKKNFIVHSTLRALLGKPIQKNRVGTKIARTTSSSVDTSAKIIDVRVTRLWRKTPTF